MRSSMYLPTVSIITVVYNAKSSIAATIASVASQTYQQIEYIVIDGGSTDGTIDVIRINEPRITSWISEADHGIYDAMNKGIGRASGEFLLFMNSGDTFASTTALAKLIESADIAKTHIIYGDTKVRGADTVIRSPEKIKKHIFFNETLCHQSVLVRRNLFDSIGQFRTQYRIVADREWLLRACIAGVQFEHIPIPVSVWDSEGFSSANTDRFKEEVQMLQKHFFGRIERTFIPWQSKARSLWREARRFISTSIS